MASMQGPDTDQYKVSVCAFGDAGLLLEFLGRRADNRLQSQFEDMRKELVAPAPKVAVPPCETYYDFLNGLAEAGRIVSDQAGSAAALDGMKPACGLSGRAFLLFSRDFLAAVAAPATVNSIRITAAYIEARRYPLWRRSAGWLHLVAPLVPPSAKHGIAASARRLASRVVFVEWLTLTFTVITLLVSAYAFSGQIILSKRQQIFTQYDRLNEDVGVYMLANHLVGTDFNPQLPPPHCDPASEPAPLRFVLDKPDNTKPVDLISTLPGIDTAAAPRDPSHFDAKQCRLYWQLKAANQDMAEVTLHLVSWTQVPLGVPLLDLVLSRTFGVVESSIIAATPVHPEICNLLGFSANERPKCSAALMDLMYRSQEVAQSLLGCITVYLLPTLYGFLGAAASELRSLRQKVEASLVTMSDRGRLQQDLILGALCGSIMGLFAGYFEAVTAATGLGLSALALLAGYNVSGALTFLGALSSRAFDPARVKGA